MGKWMFQVGQICNDNGKFKTFEDYTVILCEEHLVPFILDGTALPGYFFSVQLDLEAEQCIGCEGNS